MAIYRGFSTHEFQNSGGFRITDTEVVKRDILTHIFTSKGERIGMPDWGTSVHDILFSPMTAVSVENLRQEIEDVVSSDPRVNNTIVLAYPDYDNNSIIIVVNLEYVELNMPDQISLNLSFTNG